MVYKNITSGDSIVITFQENMKKKEVYIDGKN